MVNVLFVCLGNICRSPMAEGIFRSMVEEAGLSAQVSVDSAGTSGWHVGEPAHRGTRQVLRKHGIEYSGRSRQVDVADMRADETYIVAMDQSNMCDLRDRFGDHPRLYRLLEFAPELNVRDVPDPYYTGGFDHVYDLVTAGCRGLLDHIVQELETA